MEESLLLPEHINQSLSLISKRLGIKFSSPSWKVINGYLYLTGKYSSVLLQPAIIPLPFKFWKEIHIAARRWTGQVLPDYQREIGKIKTTELQKCSRDKLIETLKTTVELEGKLMAESVYVVLYAIASEVMLKIAYSLFVRDPEKINYYELLIGFPDAGLEADAELWKISRLKGKSRQSKIQDWIRRFGHRIQDKDILYPTLGENPETIENLVKIYRSAANPRQRIKAAGARRITRERFATKNLRSTPGAEVIFEKIKQVAKEYAKIRNSRPFYYYGNREIRRILFAIAAGIPWAKDRSDIFFLKFDELEAAVGAGNGKEFKQKIKERKSLYDQQFNSRPPLFVNL